MDLTKAFIHRIKPFLKNPEMVYEDYAYVLSEAKVNGINTAEAYGWCEDCEQESIVDVDTETFEWKCPNCNKTSNQ